MALARALAVGEQQHALFAERIAAIAGQHMHEIVGVALAEAEPLDQIVIDRPPRLFEFRDETGGRETFAFHEITIGMRDRTGRSFTQGIVIVEDGRQKRFAAP